MSTNASSPTAASAAAANQQMNVAIVKGPPMGLDLGHTYSCVALAKGASVEVIANEQGNRSTPMYLAFTEKERLVGEAAQAQIASNLANTIHQIKRIAGLDFEHERVQYLVDKTKYELFRADGVDARFAVGTPLVRVSHLGEQRVYSVEDLLVFLFSDMKGIADRYTGSICSDCVLAVPSSFGTPQRALIQQAAAKSGLRVLGVLPESVAAVQAFGLDQNKPGVQHVLVVDVGGATTHVSVVLVKDGLIRVQHEAHNLHLGGDNFDAKLLEHFCAEFKRQNDGADLKNSVRAVTRLTHACERAKRVLSTSSSADIELDGLFEGLDFFTSITRARFETICMPFFRDVSALIASTIAEAGLSPHNITSSILVGGSTRMPRFVELVKSITGKEPLRMANPEEAVAHGCALQANLIASREAEWAAVMKQRESQDAKSLAAPFALPTLSLSIGVESEDGTVVRVLPRGTPLPASTSFLCACPAPVGEQTYESLPALSLAFFEGERALATDNHALGKLHVVAPAGVKADRMIKVELKVGVDGSATVVATILGSTHTQELVLSAGASAAARWNDAHVAKHVESVSKARDADVTVRRVAELRNELAAKCAKLAKASAAGSEPEDAEIRKLIESVRSWVAARAVQASSDPSEWESKEEELDAGVEALQEKKQARKSHHADDVDDFAAGHDGFEPGIDELD